MKMVQYVLALALATWLAFEVSSTVGEVFTQQAEKVCDILEGGR